MASKTTNRMKVRSEVLTLRMTEEEMLHFRIAALAMGRKRASIVRERVADLIGGDVPFQEVPVPELDRRIEKNDINNRKTSQ